MLDHKTLIFELKTGILSPFMQMRPNAFIQSPSPLCIATQTTGYWSGESFILLIGYQLRHILGTERRTQVRSTYSLLQLGAMDRTSGQPQVKLSLLHSISLKIRPLVCHCSYACTMYLYNCTYSLQYAFILIFYAFIPTR